MKHIVSVSCNGTQVVLVLLSVVPIGAFGNDIHSMGLAIFRFQELDWNTLSDELEYEFKLHLCRPTPTLVISEYFVRAYIASACIYC